MGKYTHQLKNLKMKHWLTVAGLVVVVGGVGLAAALHNKHSNPKTPTPVVTTPSTEKVDMSPATATDQQQADQHKDDLVKQQQPTQSSPSTGTVTPVIISASQNGVRGFVPGIYESGGTCTATFTQGSQQVVKQSSAVKGATTTDCTPITLARADFPSAGTWTLVLSYSSTASHGSSASQTITVQ